MAFERLKLLLHDIFSVHRTFCTSNIVLISTFLNKEKQVIEIILKIYLFKEICCIFIYKLFWEKISMKFWTSRLLWTEHVVTQSYSF